MFKNTIMRKVIISIGKLFAPQKEEWSNWDVVGVVVIFVFLNVCAWVSA